MSTHNSAVRLVITIDGPAASGKSSTAKRVAAQLGLRHLDSGALYRAATAAQLRRGVAITEWTEASVLEAARGVTLVPVDRSFELAIGGTAVDAEIRAADVTRHVSQVAQMPGVRAWVNRLVRESADQHDIVVDGRDMGTAVFPDAPVKVFLVADTWERARRRIHQQRRGDHRDKASTPTDAEIAEEADQLARRDGQDATQSARARDAILIDTTYITQDEQVDRIVALAEAARHRLSR